MQDLIRSQKAQNIRGVIRYVHKFRDSVAVIYIDDKIINSSLFSSHIRDISLLHSAGLKVVIVPGAKTRIDQVLSDSRILWKNQDGIRITEQNAIPQIKMAAFDVSNIVMTSLAAHQITAITGNWVKARAKGVIDGVDFGTAGKIDTLQTNAILNTLNNGFIPVFPCIGWSSTGKPYNISSIELAKEVAINLKAEKLIFLMKDAELTNQNFIIPDEIGLSEENQIVAMNVEELDKFLKANSENSSKTLLQTLNASKDACTNGVSRSHILNGNIDGSLVCEIFSDIGCGSMIYSSNYGKIRNALVKDIPAILSVINPFIQNGILIERTEQDILNQIDDFVVYEINESIKACAALHFYSDGQAEIACVAVEKAFSNMGIGPKLIEELISKAKKRNSKCVFILTTQSSDWFEKLGFTLAETETMSQERKKLWNKKRNSKLFRLKL